MIAFDKNLHSTGIPIAMATKRQLSLPVDRALRLAELVRPGKAVRLIEIGMWSVLVRLLLATVTTERALSVLDALPRRSPRCTSVEVPAQRWFKLAGACLGQSLARSQYLRTRGYPTDLVIGVRGGVTDFAAHAWLLNYDSADDTFVEIRRIRR